MTAFPADPLRDLDIGWAAVKAHNGRCDLIVMNEGTMRLVLDQMRIKGVDADWRVDPRLPGHPVLHWNGTPICRCDFVTNEEVGTDLVSTVFFMALGKPNGVYAAVSARTPRIAYKTAPRANAPFESIQASLFSCVVSPTNDALIGIAQFPTFPPV